MHASGGGAGRGGEKGLGQTLQERSLLRGYLRAPGFMTMTRATIKTRTLNQPSHAGAPEPIALKRKH